MKPAVFLDRDGTLIELVHYLADPDRLVLIRGAAEAIRTLQGAGYRCVVVTNQSAVGRGILSLEGLEEIHERLRQQLAQRGTRLDALYFCPSKPGPDEPARIDDPDRKPLPGMLLRAAREHDLSLVDSWMVGDSASDVSAGRNARCRGSILVRTGYGAELANTDHGADYVVDDIGAAAELILKLDGHLARGECR